ncbi:DMT family transporter [Clostridium swellfunianum]|uniref:DMT family transporter n=1 Tax=Clostridium swellfunianum TaxID=1367462 RepID=UPI00202F6DDC|nr:DMT family transporter [Clostridium swellfunianum]MCM0648247.1 DMT family transporter [Clostridium swellfunianum]
MNKVNGIIYALLSSAAFGFMPIFAKLMYNSGSNTLTVLSVRFLLAAFILMIYFLIKRIDFKVSKTQLILLCLIGVVGYTSTGLTLFYSYNYVSVGLATTMHFIYPAVVIIFNYFFYKEGFTKNKITALLLSLAGVYVLIGVKTEHIHLGGAFIALLSGFTYAGCVMGMNRSEVKGLPTLVSVFYFSLSAGFSLLIFTILSGNLYLPANIVTISSGIGISLISTIVSIGLFVKALKIIGPASTSILGTFEPIVSIIMGVLLFNEKVTVALLIGTLLILSSVFILAKEKQST